MANHVKVSCLGPVPREVDLSIPLEGAVTEMIEFWKAQLSNVLPDRPDLIVLEEASDRPVNYPREKRREFYCARGERILDFFRETARNNNCHIAYPTLRTVDDGTCRNSTILIDRKGNVAGIYNKNHTMVTEHAHGEILCGREARLMECDFGKVACAICFDLNFDELRLKYAAQKPDIILFSSMYHGGLMQSYWAYSCRAYFAGAVARYPCTLLSPVGDIVASGTNYFNDVTGTVNLDRGVFHLDFNRPKLRAMKEKYGTRVKIHDPGYLGSVLVTSETDEFTVKELADEFELEYLDDYFERSLAHRRSYMEGEEA